MNHTVLFTLAFGILLSLLAPVPGHAHKVRIFAWEEGGTIKTESVFSGGRPAKSAQISVTSGQDRKLLLSGKTDEDGMFSFPVPATAKENQSDLEITVNSGDGHKNSWLLEARDYLQTTGNGTPPRPPPVAPDTFPGQPTTTPDLQQKGTVSAADQAELYNIIESALDKQLGPIRRSLAELQDKKVSLQDILGGIGYILGLAGIAAYFKSQKNQ
ncbi:MAG: cobalamin biosynthesis protein CbiL [Deltaproteobacteria bacterium]|nr:cobalamin biosynthesis protein CbiL [Deltaproteobacteria bacterium]